MYHKAHQDMNVVMFWAEVNKFQEHQDLDVVMFGLKVFQGHQDLNVFMFLVRVKYILRILRSESYHALASSKCISRTARSCYRLK